MTKHPSKDRDLVRGFLSDIQTRFFKNGAQVFKAFPARGFRGVHVRIELQADITLISQPFHGFKDAEKLDDAVSGNEMIVNPALGDIF